MDGLRRRVPGARNAILAATRELIRSQGVAGTSISDVVARSGTSAGAIYHHFGNKERLVLEVGRSVIAVPMMMILQTSSGLSPADLFRAAVTRIGQEDEAIAETLLQIWSGAKADPLLMELLLQEASTVKVSIATFIQAWCSEHAPDVDPGAVASLIMGLVSGYVVQRSLGIDVDVDSYRELGARMLTVSLDGAGAPA